MKILASTVLVGVGIGLASAAIAQAPPNDRCSTAQLIQRIDVPARVDLMAATTTANEGQQNAVCDQFDLGPGIPNDVWFRWAAPNAGQFEFFTASNGDEEEVDTKLAVHSGWGCVGTILACNDDFGDSFSSKVSVALTAGQQVLIQVGMSPDPVTDQGVSMLWIHSAAAPPANDECSAALGLPAQLGVFGFDLNGATTGTAGQGNLACDQNDEGTGVADDVWFRWTAPSTALYRIEASADGVADGAVLNTKLAVYRGTTCPGPIGSPAACNDDYAGDVSSRVEVQLSAGESLLIQVGRSPSSDDPATRGVLTMNRPVLPANDECVLATDLTSQIGEFAFDTSDATSAVFSQGDGRCGAIEHDVWYWWTAPCSGRATVSTVGLTDGLDTILAVYRGTTCQSVVYAGCNDDAVPFLDNGEDGIAESMLEFSVQVGERLLIRLGSPIGGGGGRGQFAITCGGAPRCPCDFNSDGAFSVQDVFDFLTAYFAGGPDADINRSLSVSVQDVFDFLAAYFTGPAACVPHCPASAMVSGVAGTTADVSWADVSDDESGFIVRVRSTDGGFTDSKSVPRNATQVHLEGLPGSTELIVEVRSANRYGQSSCFAAASFRTPAPLTNLRADPLCRGVALAWELNIQNEDEVRVAISRNGGQSWDLVASLEPHTTSCLVKGLAPATTYWFRARAHTDEGYTEYSNVVQVQTGSACVLAAPTNCVATRDPATPAIDVIVTFQNNAPGATGVRIARSLDGVNWDFIAEVPATQSWYRDADPRLDADVRYYYHVRAVYRGPDGTYYSGYSNTDDTIPRAPTIAAPTGLSATRDDATSWLDVVIAWFDNSNNETGFNIARSLDQVNWDQVGSVGADVTVFRDTVGLEAGRRYYYRVRAKRVDGDETFYSDYSNIDDSIPRLPSISAPNMLSAYGEDATSEIDVTIIWVDTSDNEDGFRIARSVDGVNWDLIGVVGPNQTSYRDADCSLDPNGHYFYHVRAFGVFDGTTVYSDYTNTDEAVARPPVVAAPTMIDAGRNTSTPALDVDIVWADNASNETGYEVQRALYSGTTRGSWSTIARLPAGSTRYTDAAGLQSGYRYSYQVRATIVTRCGRLIPSPYSASADAIPR